MNDRESRIKKVIFSDDMCNFINDGRIDEHLDDIATAIYDNTIVNLKIKDEAHKQWISGDMDDSERCRNIAQYLQSEGGYIVQTDTPIPKHIQKDEDGIRSWSSSFGYHRIVVFYIRNFEDIKLEILKYEENMFNEIYKTEQSQKKDES